ncbi:MAG: PHP domain-containing protein [Syntrophales bacterium]|nr:PHP domain-containing protein [Syntrophales bacterium]
MLRVYRCDLHIHTCLSPCGDLDMYPRAIVRASLEKGLDCIAICDHNTAENVAFVERAARQTPLKIIPGMEITTVEEVHVLALFDNLNDLIPIQEMVYRHLPGENDEQRFGCQAIVNENDEVEGFLKQLLIGSTDLPLKDIVNAIHTAGGMALAAHIDRESFSVISQLGFISQDMQFDAVEISSRLSIEEARRLYPDLIGMPMIKTSDAHFIKEIGKGITEILVKSPTIEEFKMAFNKAKGRLVLSGYD